MARRTRILAAAGLAAASLLGFLFSERGPWPVERGVGFSHTVSSKRDLIRLTKIQGDVTCYLRLEIPRGASISTGYLGQTKLRATPDSGWWRIEDPRDAIGRFNWYSGGTIEIRGTHLDVLDWEVLGSSGSDSKTRTSVRGWLSVFSIFLLVTSIAGIIIQALRPPDIPPPFRPTADNCAFAAVEWLRSHEESETERLREVLAEWLILKSMPAGANYRDHVLLIEGKRRLRVFLASLAKDLEVLVVRLTP